MNKTIEILLCIVLGIVSLPFFLLACLVVIATLGRPLFFAQHRSGLLGRPFLLYKLRSMRDTRDSSGELLADAERQTFATSMLRRLRLDEVPQLLLILRGDMALVGPRPLLPETIASFGAEGQTRCSVRPGLTGWSQVSGNTSLLNEEKLQLDLWYVAHRSFALDLKILGETLGVALNGEHRDVDRIKQAAGWLAAEKGSSMRKSPV